MPELPEVETIRSQLESIVGSTIISVEYTPSKVIRGDMQQVTGAHILAIERYGKLLIIYLSDDQALSIHLKMTGRLSLLKLQDTTPSYTHIIFTLRAPSAKHMESRSENVRFSTGLPIGQAGSNSNKLTFSDMRKFGFVSLHTRDQIFSLPFIRNLGKEPLKDLTLEDFENILNRSRRAIKVLLLDQNKIAGIGNIYDCEALWMAQIRPQTRANRLKKNQVKKLFHAIHEVLKEGIARGGASDNSYRNLFGGKGEYQNFFKVYGRMGKPCLRCQTPIIRVALGGRGTFFCPKCQK